MPGRSIWGMLGLLRDAGGPLAPQGHLSEEAMKERGKEGESEINFFPVVHRRGITISPSLSGFYHIPYHGAHLSGGNGSLGKICTFLHTALM